MRMHLICIDPKRVAEFGPAFRPWIAEAIANGDLSTLDYTEQSVLSGRALLWVSTDGERAYSAAVTEIEELNGRRILVILACGGQERSKWLPLIAEIEAFALSEKCQAVRIWGRKGWARALRDYRIKRIMLEKELT